ncbi:TdeIII family type II restriction endonuclease [Fervidobacterium sp.]
MIKSVIGRKNTTKTKVAKVDLYIEDAEGRVYMFDLKTAKPNSGEFKNLKRTLLEWIAIYLNENPGKEVYTYLAIPYNPYEPKPYERWTMKGMIDVCNELKVAEEFWDFLGGEGTYSDLLVCFENAGLKLRPELDSYFEKFK